MIRVVGVSILPVLAFAALSSCERDEPGASAATVSMDFRRASGFYDAPFPSEDLRGRDGRIDVSGVPNPDGIEIVGRSIQLIAEDVDGFGRTSGMYFRLSRPADPQFLPSLPQSIEAASAVQLISVDPVSPDYGRRYPIDVSYEDDGGPFGAPRLLEILPLQGIPLKSATLYAAVVTTRLRSGTGQPFIPSPVLRQIESGSPVEGLGTEAAKVYRVALVELRKLGLPVTELAAAAVFRTGSPQRVQMELAKAAAAQYPLSFESEPSIGEIFDDYCVFNGTVQMPDFQDGDAPYLHVGGRWSIREGDTLPRLQHFERARVVLTIPRAPMRTAGYPMAVMSRTGGGGDRPLVDRGRQAKTGGAALIPGTGPAIQFAKAGFAGATVDGPHGGLRNVTQFDEQFLMFNPLNPAALRDNVRQSALELHLLADLLAGVRVDTSACPGAATEAYFDPGHMALMGHSMGATIAPLAVATQPLYRALLLSGSGGSWIANLVYKKHPLNVRPIAELMLRYAERGRTLTEFDPSLSLVQWAGEASDSPIYSDMVMVTDATGLPPYAARVEPPNILMMQGIVDSYILPPIANSESLSLGLDLAGRPLDAAEPRLAGMRPLAALLRFSGGREVALPVESNRSYRRQDGTKGTVTAIVQQYPEDGVQDGHEVVYQTEAPKHQYRCFLQSFASGSARAITGTAEYAPCMAP